jgi:hypothetical protein
MPGAQLQLLQTIAAAGEANGVPVVLVSENAGMLDLRCAPRFSLYKCTLYTWAWELLPGGGVWKLSGNARDSWAKESSAVGAILNIPYLGQTTGTALAATL